MYFIVYVHFVGVPNNVCWVGVWRWCRSTKERLKELRKLPAPKIGGMDVEIIRLYLISNILSRHFWMNWRWPQQASITTDIYKPRFELITTLLRYKNSNHYTANLGFLFHLPFYYYYYYYYYYYFIIIIITIIIIVIIIFKVAEWFRAFLEGWLTIYMYGKQISAVYRTLMSTVVFSTALY